MTQRLITSTRRAHRVLLMLVATGGLRETGLCATPTTETRPLDNLALESASQGWGALQIDKAVSGGPINIAGRKFARGLGTHANSEIVYDLENGAGMFHAWVGVDNHLKDHPDARNASVVFQVFGDGNILFDSGVMRMGDPAKEVSVPLKGVAKLRLLANDAGDGISCDHADWADPTLTVAAGETSPSAIGHTITADGFSLHLSKDGEIVGAKIGSTGWAVSGGTRLRGFRVQGAPQVSADGAAVSVTRPLSDESGHSCILMDRFTPEHDSVRWEMAVTSADPFWSAPIITRMRCAKPEETLVWTAWGSPDYSGERLTPELAALVQAGKAVADGVWSDPLVPTAFLDRRWHYGNTGQNCPVGGDYVTMPLFTLLAPGSDTGLSLVLSPKDVLLNVDLAVSSAGGFQFARGNHRLGGGNTVGFTMHLVPHEASWRGGLRFMTSRYPESFEAPNHRAHKVAGCGAYTLCEAPIDVGKFRKMAFGFNWKLSDDFPYMGMFIPPVKDMDEKWTRSCGEPAPKGQGPETSCRQMNDYAKYMKENGFAVLSYFNVTEFGKNMYGRQAVRKADDPDLWKDPVAYLRTRLPNAVFDPGITTCYNAHVTDPGDPDYRTHLLEQAARNTALLPDTDGICIDRADWLRLYNPKADDGVSWINGSPARSLFRSWLDLMSRMGPLMHGADKLIFSNMMTMRLELCRELDGNYTEFGNNGNALNGSAMLGIRKPVVAWTYNETLTQPDPDAFMQRHLHLGVFPTAPYPNNNHCINPEPGADRLYLDYGPLLNAMRGKKWVLTPHCVECDTAKVNLFEVPGGYAIPVTFGGKHGSTLVRIRDIPGIGDAQAVAIHPGVDAPVPVSASRRDGVLTLAVPLLRGCAMVRLTAAR